MRSSDLITVGTTYTETWSRRSLRVQVNARKENKQDRPDHFDRRERGCAPPQDSDLVHDPEDLYAVCRYAEAFNSTGEQRRG